MKPHLRKHDLTSALQSLRPNSSWAVDGDTLIWYSENIQQPTQEEIDAEITRLNVLEEQKYYQTQRKAEYPPFEQYLDGVVKGDQTQIQAYIDACLAVKQKYPKPGL